MTISFNDLSADALMSGDALLAELNRSILKAQTAQKGTTAKYTNWRAAATAGPQGETPSGMIFETLFMSFMMHSLFGLPMFAGLGMGQDAATGLGALGSALHHDMSSPSKHDINLSEMISDAMLSNQKSRYAAVTDAQNAQIKEFAEMKKMLMLIMMHLMTQKEKSGGSEETIAPDILRHPKLARFKQNRHSMDCIRSLFKDQAAAVAPMFSTPHYN